MLSFAESCLAEAARPVTLDGLELVVTASIGIAVIDDHHDVAIAIRRADIATFNAKTLRLGVETYRDEIDRRTPARLSMLGDLRTAIEREDLRLHYQPKLDLGHRHRDRCRGARALDPRRPRRRCLPPSSSGSPRTPGSSSS